MPNKRLGFKSFISGEEIPEIAEENSQERELDESETEVDEAISFQTRRGRARTMKRIKSRLKVGRVKADKKTAGMPVLKKRSSRSVRGTLFKKFSKGADKSTMSAGRKASIEDRISKLPKTRVQNMVRKLIPTKRKIELERKSNKK